MHKLSVNNRDSKTVEGFGDEWERFDQSQLSTSERLALFNKYFKNFPWEDISNESIGFDMGCGSGRWAKLVASRVGTLHCIDPSSAIEVAKKTLAEFKNCVFHQGGVGDLIFSDNSMDFGYSLGVLHHVPDTQRGLDECVRYLKPGAPLLVYLYYAFDNRPFWFRSIWMLSDLMRRVISKLPYRARYFLSQLIAFFVYLPLARFSLLVEKLGCSQNVVHLMPLSFYRHLSIYTMRTDALDRFGTQLEQRFTRAQILKMMTIAGLENITFSSDTPFWCAVGFKAS